MSDPHFRREQLEAARYYLGPRFRMVAAGDSSEPAATELATTYDIDCLAKPNRQPAPNAKAFYGMAAQKEAADRRTEPAPSSSRRASEGLPVVIVHHLCCFVAGTRSGRPSPGG